MTGQPSVDEDAPRATLHAETARFGRSAAVYVTASLLVRGVTLLLTPLYTRTMGPGDFAIVAIANAVGSVLTLIFGLDLSGCVIRLAFDYTPERRRAFFGTLLVLSTASSLAFVAVLYALGSRGALDVFGAVRFHPHLEIVVWTSFFNVFPALPLAVYTTLEQPSKAALLGAAGALAQLALTLILVAWLRQGVLGVLRANLVGAAVVGVLSVVLMARMSDFRASLFGAGRALAFSLPLVPHLVANWALAISDRLILSRYVPAADVGRYSLGYMFNVLLAVVAGAIGSALQPMAYRQLKDPVAARNVPPLGTYAIGLVFACALGIALSARDVLSVVAPHSYDGAVRVVPWVVLGAVFQGMYLVLSTGTWFSAKTKPVAFITLTSAALNVGLNLSLVPRFGFMVAAVSTAVSYALSALLHGMLAHRLHPIAWEYRRWALLFAAALAWYFVGGRLSVPSLAGDLAVKTAVVGLAYPLTLVALGFFTEAERARAGRAFRRVAGGLRR